MNRIFDRVTRLGRRRVCPAFVWALLSLSLPPWPTPLPWVGARSAAAAGPRDAAGGGTEPLTMQRAVQLALADNEAPAMALSQIAQARAARREAWARLLPRLSAAATYVRRPEEVTREFGGQRGVFQALDALSSVASGRVTLLEASAIPQVRAAGREVDARQHDAAETRRLLAFETAETFLVVLSAEELERAALRRQQQANAWLELASKRLQTGLGNQVEETRARLEVASAALAATRARNAVRSARLALGYLVAADGEVAAPLAPPPEAPPPPQQTGPGAGALERDAATRRPDVRAAELRVEAARLAEREPWLRLVPTLSFEAMLRLTNETGFTGRIWDYTLALSLGWELYDGGARYAQARSRAARLVEARLQARLKRRQVRRELRAALIDLQTAQAALTQARAQLTLAQQHHEQARERYAGGLASALELADATTAAFEAESEVARQKLAERSARLQLLRAAGSWPVAAPAAADGTRGNVR